MGEEEVPAEDGADDSESAAASEKPKSLWQKFREEFEKQVLQNAVKGILALIIAVTLVGVGLFAKFMGRPANEATHLYGEASRLRTRSDEELQAHSRDTVGIATLPVRSYAFVDPLDWTVDPGLANVRVKPQTTTYLRHYEVQHIQKDRRFIVGHCIPAHLEVSPDADPSVDIQIYPVATKSASQILLSPLDDVMRDPEGVALNEKVRAKPEGSPKELDLMVIRVRRPGA